MLDRGEAAKYATSIFYQTYNDFDVYVEDTAKGYVKIFANLLSRAIGSNVALERVFPLGARINVINAAKQDLNANRSRKAVFLIDGDLNLLSGEPEQLPSNTIALPRYCIENFLYDEKTFLAIIDEEAPNLSIDQIRDKFDYSGWLQRSLEPLRELFIVFAAARNLGSGFPTVCQGHSSVCLNGNGEVDDRKAKEIIALLTQKLILCYGEQALAEAQAAVSARINKNLCFVSTYVSAKDYSLPLLVIRLKSICGTKVSNINLKMRFSKICSIEPLAMVATSIKRIAELQ